MCVFGTGELHMRVIAHGRRENAYVRPYQRPPRQVVLSDIDISCMTVRSPGSEPEVQDGSRFLTLTGNTQLGLLAASSLANRHSHRWGSCCLACHNTRNVDSKSACGTSY